jgi:hypothetical protein
MRPGNGSSHDRIEGGAPDGSSEGVEHCALMLASYFDR